LDRQVSIPTALRGHALIFAMLRVAYTAVSRALKGFLESQYIAGTFCNDTIGGQGGILHTVSGRSHGWHEQDAESPAGPLPAAPQISHAIDFQVLLSPKNTANLTITSLGVSINLLVD
jgi:hypothetical protein